MTTHVIIGKGNLGVDLQLTCESMGNKAHIFTPSTGFSWPESREQIVALQPDYVWITAGFGSVEQCKKNPNGAFDTHIGLPLSIIKALPEARVGLFSTDYAADETDMSNANKLTRHPKSIYALSKMCMENSVKLLNRPNVSVFRVSSLYGRHFPERTFPGKILQRFTTPCEVTLPQNFISPTSTAWIAEAIMSSLPMLFSPVMPLFHNCSATGGTTVMNFGRKILGDKFTFNSKGMDWERPAYSNIECSFTQGPNWEKMWEANRDLFLQSLPSLSDVKLDSPLPKLPVPEQSQQ